jgi:hypothetical protein
MTDVVEPALSGIERIKAHALEFSKTLKAAKDQGADFPWYAYDSMANIWTLDRFLTGENRNLFQKLKGKHIADIGAADGDISFLMESLGCTVDIIDNPPTNMNGVRGAALVKERLNSGVNIHHIDLDEYFTLPGKYEFAFFMGILYHLQNPYYVMKKLAENVHTMVLSTRVASHPPVQYRTGVEDLGYNDVPLAYLLHADESNGDWTNYWTFTDGGLKRLIGRTGWEILDYQTFSHTDRSDPADPERDARAFCYLRSTAFKP